MSEEAKLLVDGASLGNPGPAGIGVIIDVPSRQEPLTINEYLGEATNNVAEYQALIRGLEECRKLGLKKILVMMDSELVVRQMKGEYRVKEPNLLPLYAKANKLVKLIGEVKIEQITRKQNKIANNLAQNMARTGSAQG